MLSTHSDRARQICSAFGIADTSAQSVHLGSCEDLMDAFQRHVSSSPDRYTLEEFKDFTAAVVEAGKCEYPGLVHYGHLLSAYVQRVPDMGWERCARQVWPLLTEVRDWVEEQSIPIEKIAVRPSFTANPAVPGGYTIRAYLCNHNVDGCDCGH